MKLSPLFFLLVLFIACNDNETATATSEPATATQASDETPEKPANKNAAPVADAAVDAPALATIDMGNYIFRVHEILQYHPSAMQGSVLKLDDRAR